MYMALLGIFVVITLIVAVIDQQKRYEGFLEVARKNKFTSSSGSFVLDKIISSRFELFKADKVKVTRGFYKKVDKHEIFIAIVETRIRNRNNKGGRDDRYTHTIVCFLDSNMSMPNLSLYDENIAEKFLAFIGGQDIDFDEDPDFSNRFVLQGPSEVSARDFFTKPMRTYFVQNFPRGFSFDTGDDRFILKRRGYINKEQLEQLLKVGKEIHQRVKLD